MGGAWRGQLADRLTSDEVPVHEMCELFSEGKGLEQALTGYLDEQKATVEAIDRGEGIRAFHVVAPSSEEDSDFDFDNSDDGESRGGRFTPQQSSPDDDIPF